MSRSPSLLILFLRKLAFERPQPFCQSILATGAETIALFFDNDLHAVRFTAGYRIDLNGVDDAGEGDDKIGGVFL